MKKLIAIFCAVLISFSLSTPIYAGTKSAVLIDAQTGRVLFEYNKDEKLPMASTTKIMTALLTLEQPNLDEYFTVDSNAIKVEGTSMGLKAGDKVTLRILAAGMLLASGNDGANAAAVRISGGIKPFVKLMNERAKAVGMSNTSFETPSGLDGENHYSTAYDMALLAREALQNPEFAAICGQKSMALEYGDPPHKRWLSNHNKLLKTLDGCTGVKTGFTDKAGRCLVSSVTRGGISLICVTLNCSDDWNYHTKLYEEYFDELEAVSFPGLSTEIPVVGGESKTAVLKSENLSIALLPGEAEQVETVLSKPGFVFAPMEKGSEAGKVLYYLNGKILAETPLLTKQAIAPIKEKNIFEKIKDLFT